MLSAMISSKNPSGILAFETTGVPLTLEVLKGPDGFYLGTRLNGKTVSRESQDTWLSYDEAAGALEAGECAWTQA